ncbi:MAG: hypothetical protein ACI9OD_000851 [Limisphaerales bacterium]
MRRTRIPATLIALFAPVAVLVFSTGAHGAEDRVTETRETLAKWVEARQMISRLNADWEEDRQTLRSTISLFDGQRKQLESKLAKVGEDNVQVVKETTENDVLHKNYMAALEKLEELIVGFEGKLKAQVNNYPPPLRNQEFLAKLLTLVPEDSAKTEIPLISRFQNLILILKAVQEFNSELHVVTEIRKHRDKDVEVKTLYLGLGQAWFVDGTGGFAGTGGPSAAGWVWDENPAISESVRRAIAVYEKGEPATYVGLPVEVK